VCLTPGNLHEDWILYEAGALSKKVENPYCCTLLIGLEPADVESPLADFQATRLEKAEILQLLKTLNQAAGTEAMSERHIDEMFEALWPKLEEKLKLLPSEMGGAEGAAKRTNRQLLEELLILARNQAREPHIMRVLDVPELIFDILNSGAVRHLIGELKSSSIGGSSETNYNVRFITEDGKSYSFSVPSDTSPASVRAVVLAHLADLKSSVTEPIYLRGEP
jgi:hypothetical protein